MLIMTLNANVTCYFLLSTTDVTVDSYLCYRRFLPLEPIEPAGATAGATAGYYWWYRTQRLVKNRPYRHRPFGWHRPFGASTLTGTLRPLIHEIFVVVLRHPILVAHHLYQCPSACTLVGHLTDLLAIDNYRIVLIFCMQVQWYRP